MFEITDINNLKPLEQVFRRHLANIEKSIKHTINKPIIADKNTGTILDGSHRYAYFLKHGYKTVPVLWVDYSNENIRVGSKLIHRFLLKENEGTITKTECIERAQSGNLFPPRTTRHFFPFRKMDKPTELINLAKGEPRDISHLLSEATLVQEIEHNQKFIKEIDEELEALNEYRDEVYETRQYLNNQIHDMRGKILFPGKFNPPHIGHMRTFAKLTKDNFNTWVVGVTEDVPENAVLTPDEIVEELKEVLNVEVVKIPGKLTDRENADDLLEMGFGVIASGNPEVLEWAEKVGLQTMRVERSGKITGGHFR